MKIVTSKGIIVTSRFYEAYSQDPYNILNPEIKEAFKDPRNYRVLVARPRSISDGLIRFCWIHGLTNFKTGKEVLKRVASKIEDLRDLNKVESISELLAFKILNYKESNKEEKELFEELTKRKLLVFTDKIGTSEILLPVLYKRLKKIANYTNYLNLGYYLTNASAEEVTPFLAKHLEILNDEAIDFKSSDVLSAFSDYIVSSFEAEKLWTDSSYRELIKKLSKRANQDFSDFKKFSNLFSMLLSMIDYIPDLDLRSQNYDEVLTDILEASINLAKKYSDPATKLQAYKTIFNSSIISTLTNSYKEIETFKKSKIFKKISNLAENGDFEVAVAIAQSFITLKEIFEKIKSRQDYEKISKEIYTRAPQITKSILFSGLSKKEMSEALKRLKGKNKKLFKDPREAIKILLQAENKKLPTEILKEALKALNSKQKQRFIQLFPDSRSVIKSKNRKI